MSNNDSDKKPTRPQIPNLRVEKNSKTIKPKNNGKN
jgi:hypothetical protein